jgi:hypothetical protein
MAIEQFHMAFDDFPLLVIPVSCASRKAGGNKEIPENSHPRSLLH